jgi:hypothetical protein
MPAINLDSIMKKVEAYGRSVNGKLRMKERIQKYSADGKGKTEAGGRVITEADMWIAASKLIGVLRSTAQSHALPASVLKHFDSLECSSIYTMSDGSSSILIYFGDDLHRDSLYSDGYEGINNVVALLNNGYHAKNYVYGWWEGHKPSGESIYNSGVGSTDAYIRSRKDREGLHFIQQAVTDFNGNYGSDFNVTAVAGEDYK